MSGYENVVGGKLKLKGKALDVAGGIKKKKKKRTKQIEEEVLKVKETDLSAGETTELAITEVNQEETDDAYLTRDGSTDDHLTPAERRYMEQRDRIDQQKLAKTSDKSHRDRIEDFNQYLANMSEHYDIPKVGPG